MGLRKEWPFKNECEGGSCSKRVMLNGDRLVLVSRKDCDTMQEREGHPATSQKAVYVDWHGECPKGRFLVGRAWSQKYERAKRNGNTDVFSAGGCSSLAVESNHHSNCRVRTWKRILLLEIRPSHSGKSSDVSDG